MKRETYWKVIKANMCGLNGIPYHVGENLFQYIHGTTYGTIYYTDIEHIFAYLNYGPLVCECEIPPYAVVTKDSEQMHYGGIEIPIWHTTILDIKQIHSLNNISTIKMLINKGADISMDNYNLFKHAIMCNNKLYHWLVKHYPNEYELAKGILESY